MKRFLVVVFALMCMGAMIYNGNGYVRGWLFGDDLVDNANVSIPITSASPPAARTVATTTEPYWIGQSANSWTCSPDGAYWAPAYTNYIWRSDFETCTANGNTEPDGWTISETVGDGTADAACTTSHKAHGAKSLQLTNTGTTSTITITSQCITYGANADVSFFIPGKRLSGTAKIDTKVLQYTTGACGGWNGGVNMRANLNFAADNVWETLVSSMTAGGWTGGTNSYKLAFVQDTGAAGDFVVDSLYIKDDSYVENGANCQCDADSDCVCNTVIGQIANNPLTAGTWTIKATIMSHVDGAEATPIRRILGVPASAAVDKNRIDLYWESDTLTIDVYTSGGVLKSATVAAAGNADTQYNIVAYHTDMGQIAACWEGTCGTETADAVIVSPSATMNVGSDGTNPGAVYIQNLKIYNRLVKP